MADSNEEVVISALQNNDQALAAAKAKEYLENFKKVPLNIAITGESGSGKSTLVNALRGIRNKTEGAAETGVKETTMEPTQYTHPQNDKISIWDLPGIGTTNFRADKYVKQMKFEKYHFFIIVSRDRFTENDSKLAKKIEKMKKKFYFVRSKIDNSIRDEKEEDPKVKEEEVLDTVRNYCTEELQKLGFESPKVFLISGFRLDQYEFSDLKKTLENDLPDHQSDVLTLALPNISLDAIEQKRKILGKNIKWFTLTSTAVAAAPVPGLSVAVDLGIIAAFTTHCVISLGLSPKLLRKLSELSEVPYEDLKAEVKSGLSADKISTQLVLKLLTANAAYITAMAIEEGARFIPIVGTIFSMVVSGASTYRALTFILKILAEDAKQVFIKAWKLNTSE